jgi:NAD(P)-dependent dehydrogenase (short-subunit alcohol dehydrogenase family)
MATSINSSPVRRRYDLSGQTVVVIGGSAGIGLETARLARAEGANMILTARNPDRLHRVGLELGASIAAFDATDFGRLGRFFDALPAPVDHLLVTGPGPCYVPLAGFDLDVARRDLDAHLLLPLLVARNVASKVRPGGTLLFLGGACGRRTERGIAFTAALTAALSAVTRDLALEIAPVRVNLIAAGCAGTLPVGRVVGPADIATLAVHLMTDTAITGATFDIDGDR